MRIGIISDTHGTLPSSALELLSGAEVIFHSGDIGGQKIIDQLIVQTNCSAIYAVLGNNDYAEDYIDEISYSYIVEHDGVTFCIAHEPETLHIAEQQLPFTDGDIVLIHGHTHEPYIRYTNEQQLILNPGALFDPRGDYPRTIALLDINNGYVENVEIVSLSGKTLIN